MYRYMKGGAESAFRHIPEDNYENWKPCLFHCKGKRNVRCTEVGHVREIGVLKSFHEKIKVIRLQCLRRIIIVLP